MIAAPGARAVQTACAARDTTKIAGWVLAVRRNDSWALEAQLRKTLVQGVVRRLENGSRLGEIVEEVLPHADELTALPRKDERQ